MKFSRKKDGHKAMGQHIRYAGEYTHFAKLEILNIFPLAMSIIPCRQ